ncbi:ATP-grasp domain-containing protein [Aspergillus lucknowensis]|uniref:Prokaryotic glutathione synthetase ATP-binding domain-containing protein n=1 Tax=Aspergillus lucknowensis TaxID=176173 RepID=A0ABR4LE26_9EURO
MKRVLFLASVPPDIIEQYVADDDWSNEMLPSRLSEMGASVTIKRWADEDIVAALLDHDVASFLWAEDYIRHPTAFAQFLDKAEAALMAHASSKSQIPRIINSIALVRWNMDKKYLFDMQSAGFDIPRTEILSEDQLPSVSALHRQIHLFQSSGSVVLKPSVSASSTHTHLIREVSALSADDLAYLEACTQGCLKSSLVIQQFEPAIALGEYSFIFIGDRLTHVTLKVPKQGENRRYQTQNIIGGPVDL